MADQSEDQLRQRALQQLEETRLTLVSVAGEVEHDTLEASALSGLGMLVDLAVGGRGFGFESQVDQEKESIVLQRHTELLQARKCAEQLCLILEAWTRKPDHDPVAESGLVLAQQLLVSEDSSDQDCHERQVTVLRLHSLLRGGDSKQ
jgi:hypothetical protein